MLQLNLRRLAGTSVLSALVLAFGAPSALAHVQVEPTLVAPGDPVKFTFTVPNESDASTTTVESATRFFRAVRTGAAHAVARPLHAGRRFVTVQTEISGDDGKLAALGQGVIQRRIKDVLDQFAANLAALFRSPGDGAGV